jgi:hypothetical protein
MSAGLAPLFESLHHMIRREGCAFCKVIVRGSMKQLSLILMVLVNGLLLGFARKLASQIRILFSFMHY